ncbi:putative Cullin [Blattamonas nauphoetae]|uniref:Cullin n=1 Tax=Blattamonas nauphoetae TaxID=2049346 RepID=A0ABQ9Y480_9EUKA|nr:putative Cullin [Blattamonas nauphoetae]
MIRDAERARNQKSVVAQIHTLMQRDRINKTAVQTTDPSRIKLASAIQLIFQGNKLTSSEEELYQVVDDICSPETMPSLYNFLMERLQEIIKTTTSQWFSLSFTENFSTFLNHLYSEWTTFFTKLELIQQIFLVLDQYYCYPNNTSILEATHRLFHTAFCESRTTQTRTAQQFPQNDVISLFSHSLTVDDAPKSLVDATVYHLLSHIHFVNLSTLTSHFSVSHADFHQDSQLSSITASPEGANWLGISHTNKQTESALLSSFKSSITSQNPEENQLTWFRDHVEVKGGGLGMMIYWALAWYNHQQKRIFIPPPFRAPSHQTLQLSIDQQESLQNLIKDHAQVSQEDMSLLFSVLNNRGKSKQFAAAFEEAVRHMGEQRILSKGFEGFIIADLICMLLGLSTIVATSPASRTPSSSTFLSSSVHPTINTAIRSAFSTFLNTKDFLAPEPLNVFIHNVLLSGPSYFLSSFTDPFGALLEHWKKETLNSLSEKDSKSDTAKQLRSTVKAGKRREDEGNSQELFKTLYTAFFFLFGATDGKDIFEAFYRNFLAKRLFLALPSSTASMEGSGNYNFFSLDTEREVIGKLKEECGAAYTSKMETMFHDVTVSLEISEQFQTALDNGEVPVSKDEDKAHFGGHSLSFLNERNKRSHLPSFHSLILTSNAWPEYPLLRCSFPIPNTFTKESESASPSLLTAQIMQNAFVAFYQTRLHNRLLTFRPSLGTAAITFNYIVVDKDSGTNVCKHKEISVSHIQAAILFLFNTPVESTSSPEITYGALKAELDTDESELKIALASLVLHPLQIVLIHTGDPDQPAQQSDDDEEEAYDWSTIKDSTKFSFNLNIQTAKGQKIRVNKYQAKEKKGEVEATNTHIMENREKLLEAAIVRIMKDSKTIKHSELVNQVMSEVRFPVTRPDVKEKIESLIERQYLERDEENPDIYHYC